MFACDWPERTKFRISCCEYDILDWCEEIDSRGKNRRKEITGDTFLVYGQKLGTSIRIETMANLPVLLVLLVELHRQASLSALRESRKLA